MFETIKNAWKIPELRKKILFTLLIIVVFRIGAAITVPFLDAAKLQQVMQGSGKTLMGYLDVLTGGAFSKATIFSMSVTPYINASIIIQLLGVAIPSLERLQKEGEVGRKKIAQITRYTTIGLGLLQGFFYYIYLRNSGVLVSYAQSGLAGVWAAITIVAVFIAGTALMMWLGEQINDKGVGNGISVLLFAGIVSRVPSTIQGLYSYWVIPNAKNKILTIVIALLTLAAIAAIVFMTDAERRIPVQYAKRVVGRKMYGGQSSFIPLKVTMSGVMPIIFAMSIVSIPTLIGQFLDTKSMGYQIFSKWFGYTSPLYAVVYFLLIIGFNYFYVAIQYNPNEIANNLKKNNGAIPGIRPGKPTADYVKRCLNRITLIGALFLGLVAVMPIAIAVFGVNTALGGTTLLILVGVAIDTSRQLESQMMMRHYKGFLE
jgi:preprotein translocase subunit SecY